MRMWGNASEHVNTCLHAYCCVLVSAYVCMVLCFHSYMLACVHLYGHMHELIHTCVRVSDSAIGMHMGVCVMSACSESFFTSSEWSI